MCSRCGCLSETEEVAVRPAVVEGVLEAALLLALSDDDGYGYDLANVLSRRNLVPSPVSPARTYEALRRLQDDGAVAGWEEESPDGPDRRRYRLTPSGRERLDRWAESLRQTERSLHRLLHAYDALRAEPDRPHR